MSSLTGLRRTSFKVDRISSLLAQIKSVKLVVIVNVMIELFKEFIRKELVVAL